MLSKFRTTGRGAQRLLEQAPLLYTFEERYCEAFPRYDVRAEDITKILQKSKWQYEMDENGLPRALPAAQ